MYVLISCFDRYLFHFVSYLRINVWYTGVGYATGRRIFQDVNDGWPDAHESTFMEELSMDVAKRGVGGSKVLIKNN